MAGYRADGQSRCTGCQVAVPLEGLFLTTSGAALCPTCKQTWADAELARANEGWTTGMSEVEGYRLLCPTCKLATMHVKRGELRFRAVCSRCGGKTTRLQPASFLGAAVMLMLAMLLLLATAPLALIPLLAGYALALGRDLWRRRRYPVATFEQIAAAERVEREARIRVAAESFVRVSEGAADELVADAEPDAAAARVRGREGRLH